AAGTNHTIAKKTGIHRYGAELANGEAHDLPTDHSRSNFHATAACSGKLQRIGSRATHSNFDCGSNVVCLSAEALGRWAHPTGRRRQPISDSGTYRLVFDLGLGSGPADLHRRQSFTRFQ